MKEAISYETVGTCCRLMNVEIEDDIITKVDFFGGCNGNLQGIRNLVIGMNVNEVIAKLKGIKCGDKPTSCPDQLATCLVNYIQSKAKNPV